MSMSGDVRARYSARPDSNESYEISRAAGMRIIGSSISRIIDFTVSGIGILTVLPIIMLICLMIIIYDGGWPLFVHRRIGRGGHTFPCFKLRTMVPNSEALLRRHLDADPVARAEWATDQKLRIDPRITPLGALLRKSSLDELPQLLNVLFGHMSLVGPRPIVPTEVDRYGRYMKFYCNVRPGITGLWQISGRNDISYRRRVAMDTLYSRTRSVGGDIRIIVRTFPAVFSSRGSF